MPGWHEETQALQEAGDLKVIGIVEEQHADRARLFMQWKQLDWPLYVDSLNLLEVGVVPIHVLIDEEGVVQKINPSSDDLKAFMNADAPAEQRLRNTLKQHPADDAFMRYQAMAARFANEPLESNQVVFASMEEYLSDAIRLGEQRVAERPNDGSAHFRLGVMYRARYDSRFREAGDFEKAIERWLAARETDPNQYIWRRRVQQYGPRLDKPYSFYDWVETAKQEIAERDEEPVELIVQPRGAELALPAGKGKTTGETPVPPDVVQPDPEGKVLRDAGALIAVDTVVVPHTNRVNIARVHLVFTPRENAHWNNEAEPISVWIEVPSGWRVDQSTHIIPNAATATSDEERRVEFELRKVDEQAADAVTIDAYALYNVCEDADGVCLYRRQDVSVEIGR